MKRNLFRNSRLFADPKLKSRIRLLATGRRIRRAYRAYWYASSEFV